MSIRIHTLGFVICLLVQTGLKAQEPEIPTGRRLREIADDKFVYGNVFISGTSGYRFWDTHSQVILNREFNVITPNNEFKQTYIHPEPDIWRWERCDGWVDRARLNTQIIRMHGPISPQASKWAKDDSRTAQELETNMTEYMTELCKRYNNVPEVRWMDVVNETVSRDGTWFGPREGTDLWENPWPLIGYDQTSDGLNPPSYIRKAFEIANEYAPNIKLIYNQHGDMEEAMWDKVKSTVLYLRSIGLRVDGIGWQAHLETDFLDDPTILNKISDLIDWAHANDLEFHVTENDVDILEGDNVNDQAVVFGAVVETVLSKGLNGVVGWNAWMIRELDGQGAAGRPTLFYDDGSPKPAYYTVQSVLENIDHESTLTTSVEGQGSISANSGDYLKNSLVTLEAIPVEGYEFLKWEGLDSPTLNPQAVIMSEDRIVTAHFIKEGTVLRSGDIKELKIFPNPASEFIRVEGVSGLKSFCLIDINGKQVRSGRVHSGIIEMGGLTPGNYLLFFDDSEFCHRIVISR